MSNKEELIQDEIKGNYVRINRVAMMLDISDHSIRRWYKWWESPEFEHPADLFLPKYYHMDRRGTKFFKKEDIAAIRKFREQLQTTHKGIMSEFNAAFQWGKRGEKTLINKGTTAEEVRFKMR